MARRFHVYGIGNAIIDLQFQVKEEVITQLKLEKSAMRLVSVDEQQQLIRLLGAQRPHQASGGSAANTMIAIAQLGGHAAYGCLLGGDHYGEFYREEMEVLGIPLHNPSLEGFSSGTCVVLITPDAERTMNTTLGASSFFGPEHVSEEFIAQSEWLYVEGYLFSSDTARSAVERAIEYAKRHKTKIAVTFSDGFIVEVFRESLTACVKEADLIFANLNEALRFTGAADEESAFQQLRKLAPSGAMTLSAKGAWIWHQGGDEFIKPFPTKAIDDTGAGDMFAGAFLYGITHNQKPAEAGRLACYLASHIVSQLGPRLRRDVEELTSELAAL